MSPALGGSVADRINHGFTVQGAKVTSQFGKGEIRGERIWPRLRRVSGSTANVLIICRLSLTLFDRRRVTRERRFGIFRFPTRSSRLSSAVRIRQNDPEG